MKFRTELHTEESNDKITFTDKLFTIGSCFSDEIGTKLLHHGFQVQCNPYGTVFNPISLTKLLHHTIQNASVEETDVYNENDRYMHFDFHSSFCNNTARGVVTSINEAIQSSHVAMHASQWLIISLGTSFVYEFLPTGTLVSNCHKVPNQLFRKTLLTEPTMLESLCRAIDAVLVFNPKLKIIFTVSPVRHIKDGLINNNLSKSQLITSVHRLIEKYPAIQYFPAYEIMLDDLRDYRFYKEDMIHPTEQAVSYIWKKFCDVYLDDTTLKQAQDFHKSRKLALHIKHKSR